MCAHERQRYESFQINYNSCAPEGMLVESQPLQDATFFLLLFKANCSMRRIRQSGIEIECLYSSEPVQRHLCASWRCCPSLRMFPQMRGTKDHPVCHVHIEQRETRSSFFHKVLYDGTKNVNARPTGFTAVKMVAQSLSSLTPHMSIQELPRKPRHCQSS